MKCPHCGAEIGLEDVCPTCGQHVEKGRRRMNTDDLTIQMTDLCGCVFIDDPLAGLISHRPCGEHRGLGFGKGLNILEEAASFARERMQGAIRMLHEGRNPTTAKQRKPSTMGQLLEVVGIVVLLHEHIAELKEGSFLGHAVDMQNAMALVMTFYRELYPKEKKDADEGGCDKSRGGQDPDVDVLRETGSRTDTDDAEGGEGADAE